MIPAEKILSIPTDSGGTLYPGIRAVFTGSSRPGHATIINYVPFIRSFLEDRFGDGRVKLSHLCASDVVRFVQRQAPRLHQKRAKLLTTALRSFLQLRAISR